MKVSGAPRLTAFAKVSISSIVGDMPQGSYEASAEDAVRKSDYQARKMKEKIDELEREMERRLEDLE